MVSDTPWYNEIEWLYVYDGLFGVETNFSKQKEALTRIAVWESRSSDTPLSICVTKLLMEAFLVDKCPESYIGAHILQMLYGIAIVRFVNSYVDVEQNKLYAVSISLIAQKIGIPSEIVDCRHRITHHAQLPSLQLLRHAAELSLDYIRSTYWDPQAILLRQQRNVSERCHYLVLGLVAIQLDVKNFSRNFCFSENNTSLIHLETKLFHQSAPNIFLNCVIASFYKREKRRYKCLAGLLNTSAKVLHRDPYICKMLFLGIDVQRMLNNVLSFASWLLDTFSYDSILLSYLKDWLFLVVDPTKMDSFLMIIIVFWILSSMPVYFSYSVVAELFKEMISLPNSFRGSSSSSETLFKGTLIQENAINARDFNEWHTIYQQESLNKVDIKTPYCSKTRYMEWLKCLLLIPHCKWKSPFPFFVLFGLCGLRGSQMIRCETPNSESKLKGSFPHCLIRIFLTIRTRMVSILSFSIRNITMRMFGLYHSKYLKEELFLELLDIFDKAHLNNKFCVQFLRSCYSIKKNKAVCQLYGVGKMADVSEFKEILHDLAKGVCSRHKVREDLLLLRQKVSQSKTSQSRCLYVSSRPWTEPGILLCCNNSEFPFSLYKSFAELSDETTMSVEYLLKNVNQHITRETVKRSSYESLCPIYNRRDTKRHKGT